MTIQKEVTNALLDVLEKNELGLNSDPSLQDSIYGKLLRCVTDLFSGDRAQDAEKLEAFFKRNPETVSWVQKHLSSTEGQKYLGSLVGVRVR